MEPAATRFPIRFDAWFHVLSLSLFLRPSTSFVEVTGDDVRVHMAWAFRATFPRSAIASAKPYTGFTISRGVHGFGGRWLVNGSGDGLLSLELAPPQRAFVLGVPVRLRELVVSVAEPERLLARLAPP